MYEIFSIFYYIFDARENETWTETENGRERKSQGKIKRQKMRGQQKRRGCVEKRKETGKGKKKRKTMGFLGINTNGSHSRLNI